MARKVSTRVSANRRTGNRSAGPAGPPLPPPPEPPTEPSFLTFVIEYLRTHAVTIWAVVWPLLFVLIVFYYINPFGVRATDIAQDVPTAWNDAIRRLGIEPLYPPGEDFNVGDVLIVISPTGLEAKEKENAFIRNLLGRSVRIGHLNLLDAQTNPSTRTHFTSTVACDLAKDGSKICPPLNPIEILASGAGNLPSSVDLSLVGFPGVTIAAKGNASFDLGSLGVGGYAKQKSKVNIIKIPEATTYGVSEAEGLSELFRWCASPDNNILCTELTARTVLSAAYGSYVNVMNEPADWPEKGKYRLKFDLKLITRVYLTREISANTAIYDEEASNSSPPEKSGPQISAAVGNPKPDTGSIHGAGRGNTIGAVSDDSLDLNYRYNKPLVVGFKSVSLAIGCQFPVQKEMSDCEPAK